MKRKEKGGGGGGGWGWVVEVYIEGFWGGERAHLFSVHKWALNRVKKKNWINLWQGVGNEGSKI